MCWKFIIKEFGPNIQHIAVVDNIVDDSLSRLQSTLVDKYQPSTSKAQCCAENYSQISGVKTTRIVLDYMDTNNLGSQLGIRQAPYSNAMYD